MAKTNAAFMSGVPEFVIFRLLMNKEMYGYELVASIKTSSNEALSLAEGVVYPTLHSLEKRGFLKAKEKQVSGRSRVYYRTTKKGQLRLASLQHEWERINSGIQTVLGVSYA